MAEFEFNKLFIIESLSPQEISNGYNVPNISLIKCIESLQGQEQLNCFSYKLIKVNNGIPQFSSIFSSICEECKNDGIYPIIHFYGHGSQGGGIALWNDAVQNYSMLEWKKLYVYLAKVNSACHNNLFFTTAACHGFDSLKQLFADEVSTIPFVGIVAIDPYAVFYVHDATIVFCTFYKTLLETGSVIKAMDAVKSEKDKLKGIPPYIAFSDDTFRKIYPMAQSQSYSTKNIERLIDIAAKLEHWSPVQRASVASKFMQELEEYKQKKYIGIRDKKFLFDDPLVKRDRFNLPDSVNDL